MNDDSDDSVGSDNLSNLSLDNEDSDGEGEKQIKRYYVKIHLKYPKKISFHYTHQMEKIIRNGCY